MIGIGIDPPNGWAVVEAGNQPRILASGCWRKIEAKKLPRPYDAGEYCELIAGAANQIDEAVAQYLMREPGIVDRDVVCRIEGPGNAGHKLRFDAMWTIGRNAGLWQMALSHYRPEIVCPSDWRKPLYGRGLPHKNTDEAKASARIFVQATFGLADLPEDENEAIAIAAYAARRGR